MAADFLSVFLGNKGRARLTKVFVFSPSESLTISQLCKRSGLSSRMIKKELKELESLAIVRKGRGVPAPKEAWKTRSEKKPARSPEPTWLLNENFKYARALSMFVKEVAPPQHRVVIDALKKAGKFSAIILSGAFIGDTSRPADLVVAGESMSEQRLDEAIRSLEPHYGHEIRYATFTTPEFRYRLTIQDRLLRETLDYPHLILLDRAHLL